MGSIEFTVILVAALYGLFAIVAWVDNNFMHDADHEDVHHIHAPH